MKIHLIKDIDPPHPRKDWDTLGTILYTANMYKLGDRRVDADEINETFKNKELIVLPVYAHIHGNVALSTARFGCIFDSGLCGCIYVAKWKVLTAFSKKRISAKLLNCVLDALRQEVKTYSMYLNDEVYEYQILNHKNEVVDSCCGIFGYEEVKEEANQACLRAKKCAA
jgi:hypothetical protein